VPEHTVAAELAPGTEAWAKHHREAIQQRVRVRASNASALMQEIEKIRPFGDEEGVAKRGRKPRKDPRTGKPFAHILLGFMNWTDFVSSPQPDGGLGWHPDHERTMWNGWRRAKKANITPEMVDELGHAWLADVGANRNSAAKGLSLEKAQATIDEKKAKAAEPKKRRMATQVDQEKDEPKPSKAEAPTTLAARNKPPAKREVPLSTAKTPKQFLLSFLEHIAPGIEPSAALKVSQAVIPHLDPDDLLLVAKDVVPKLESDHIAEILKDMVNMLDADEAGELVRLAVRRLQIHDLERMGKDVAELLAARKGRDERPAPVVDEDEADDEPEANKPAEPPKAETPKPAKAKKATAKGPKKKGK